MRKLLLVVALLGLGCGSAEDAGRIADQAPQESGKVRRYFIGAVKTDWDYAPSGLNRLTGRALEEEEAASVFTAPGPDRIGRVYSKALYFEFTDETFTTRRIDVDPEYRARSEHLGFLGPIVRAEVGDRVEVVFKNLTPEEDGLSFSFHVHGLRYLKDSEGAPYEDGTDQKGDDRVAPGETRVYRLEADEGSGPGPMDPSSVTWMYHSHVDETRDTYSGLAGPIVVTRRGAAREDGVPTDVDRELFTLWEVVDENQSHYIAENLQRAGNPDSIDLDDGDFQESNLMHAINGYVFANLPGLTAKVGERVRWHVMGLGTEIDVHSPHWHGETVTWAGMRTDMLEIFPNSMKTADMQPDNPGQWIFHCHVNDHIDAGMSAIFTIEP